VAGRFRIVLAARGSANAALVALLLAIL